LTTGLLAAGERDGRVRLWDLSVVSEQRQSGSALAHRSVRRPIHSVAFSTDGRRIVSASDDGSVRVWDTSTQVSQLEFSYPGPVYSACFSPDNQYVLLAGKAKAVVVWDLVNDRQQMAFNGHSEPVLNVGWRKDGYAISAGGKLPNYGRADNTIRIWDPTTGREQGSFQIESTPQSLECVAFASDGGRAISGHRDGTLRLWDVETGQAVAAWKAHDQEVTCATFSRDGRMAASGSRDRHVQVWQLPP
jgi:WD40 repeat protein